MSQINPFVGSVLQSTAVQRAQAAEKDRHIQRAQELSRNAALEGDRLEHQVESTEEVRSIREEARRQNARRRQPPRWQGEQDDQAGDDEPPHLDVTA